MSHLRPVLPIFLTRKRPRPSQSKKKASKHCCFEAFYLVRLAGIEPTTPWFVAKYSIQLSYSRKAGEFSTGAIFNIPVFRGLSPSAPERWRCCIALVDCQ